MRKSVWYGKAEKRNWKDKSRKGLTLRKSEDKEEEGVKPPLHIHSFVRCV